MREVLIPNDMHPFVIEINGVEYRYPEGTTQNVPDEVASAIDAYKKSVLPAKPNSIFDSEGLSFERTDAGHALMVNNDGTDVIWQEPVANLDAAIELAQEAKSAAEDAQTAAEAAAEDAQEQAALVDAPAIWTTINIISEPTRNLFNPFTLDGGERGAHYEYAENKLRVIANNNNSYLYVVFWVDVSTLDSVTISCGATSGNGDPIVRIGKSTDKVDNTWIDTVSSNSSKTIDTSDITWLTFALYAVYQTNTGAGHYIDYSNLQIEAGSTASDYIPPIVADDVKAREDISLINSKLDVLNDIVAFGHFSSNASGTVKEISATADEKYRVYSYNNNGMSNDNNPALYVIYNDNSYTTVKFRNFDGTRYWEVTVPLNAKSLRMYANKDAASESVSCDYIFVKVTGVIGDTDNVRLNAVEEKTKLTLNRTTCKIFKKVVCCGDSYTSGHIQLSGEAEASTTNEEFAWPHYMSTLTGNEWVNCGSSGATVLTWQSSDRGLTKAQAEGYAQAYVIGLMLNDVGNVDLGTSADIGTNAQTYYGGMSKIIRELNAISPTAKIFVNTCPQTSGNFPQYNQAVKDIVEAYKNTYPVFCIDLLANKSLYDVASITQDRVNGHYTAIAYEQFAEIYALLLSEYINDHIDKFQNVHEIPYNT